MVDKRAVVSGGVEEAQVQAFQASLRGQLIRPGDSNYDEARAVYNGMIDKRPAFIAVRMWQTSLAPSISVVRTALPSRYAAAGTTGQGWARVTMGW